jgi:hypothetical protein
MLLAAQKELHSDLVVCQTHSTLQSVPFFRLGEEPFHQGWRAGCSITEASYTIVSSSVLNLISCDEVRHDSKYASLLSIRVC